MPPAISILDHTRARAIPAYLEMVKIPVLVSFVSKFCSQKKTSVNIKAF
jgi:hypothetical protein